MDKYRADMYETRMTNTPQRTLFPESHYYVPEDGWTQHAYTVVRAGKAVTSVDHFIQRDAYPGQDVMVCLSGRGFVLTEGRTLNVERNQLAWIANELPHAHWPDKTDPWTVLFVRLDGPSCTAIRKKVFGSAPTIVTLASLEEIEAWFVSLFEALRSRRDDIDLALNRFVGELVHSIAMPRTNFGKTRLPAALAEIVGKMRKEPQRSWHAEELSAVSGLSPAQTRRLFQKHLQISPRRWLTKERIMMAQKMLLETDLTVSDVADQCGFFDAYHFSREFKRSIGTSPRYWRRGEGR
ncbi:AraC family transcriptional regulator [Mesorhizobium sp.]|uniref:AraC family transcriptional regulator n=1 Tax=Mesorhizobium sp. TaxID=1871066 RepID=UPI0025FD0D7D|nr:AraC family transcriptional regulator [Mesorhizobium sp.]